MHDQLDDDVVEVLDPFEGTDDHPRRITQVTRRDVFDFIRTDGGPWSGRLDEVSFLDRLYDLDDLPTTDYRVSQYPNARADIQQHRFNNEDWPDAWVFSDPRFDLASGPDEVLLEFLHRWCIRSSSRTVSARSRSSSN